MESEFPLSHSLLQLPRVNVENRMSYFHSRMVQTPFWPSTSICRNITTRMAKGGLKSPCHFSSYSVDDRHANGFLSRRVYSLPEQNGGIPSHIPPVDDVCQLPGHTCQKQRLECSSNITFYTHLQHRAMIWYDIYLTAIGLTPGGSITRRIYNKQYTQIIESTILEVRAVPRLCELYPDICLTTERKARKKPQLG